MNKEADLSATSDRPSVLFVDDEADLRASAADWLTLSGFDVVTADSMRDALQAFSKKSPDIVVSDIRMPGGDGLALLTRIKELDKSVPVVLLTGHGDVTLAVDAMRRGALDFLEKPYDADHLVVVLTKAAERRRLSREVARLQALVDGAPELAGQIVGSGDGMEAVRRQIRQLADYNVDILLHGETGTGKEVVARALHDFGSRSAAPFVAINCAAIPEQVFEAEMFGHAKGAFTGAAEARTGKLEYAAGGTVFLDEIDAMPLPLQAKVLRAIQERQIERLGENQSRSIDVRFIAATKADLKAQSEAGHFRSDLYFRLATAEIKIPPLRERGDDIGELFLHFVKLATHKHSLGAMRPVDEHVFGSLLEQAWPGNVRELKAHAERFALGLGDQGMSDDSAEASLSERVATFEAGLIKKALAACDGSATQAAQHLGIPRRTLSEKMARLGLR